MWVLVVGKLKWPDVVFSLNDEQSYFFNIVKKFTFYPFAKNHLPEYFLPTSRALIIMLWYMCDLAENNKDNKEINLTLLRNRPFWDQDREYVFGVGRCAKQTWYRH